MILPNPLENVLQSPLKTPLNKRYGNNIIHNGLFNYNTDYWEPSASGILLTWNAGKADITQTVAWKYIRATPTISAPAGLYLVSADISAISGSFHIGLSSTGNTITSVGSFEYIYNHSGGNIEAQIRPTTGALMTLTIDNFLARKIF